MLKSLNHFSSFKKNEIYVSGSLGNLSTRLANSATEARRAQHLRYQVFCEEQSARPKLLHRLLKRDYDRHDRKFDHLLVIDDERNDNGGIVGTQRLQVLDASNKASNFYSSSEFNIAGLLARHPNKRFMELGRSCIHTSYRNKRTMELMWHGTWDYALKSGSDVMFGCASFQADNTEAVMPQLVALAQLRPAIGEWAVEAVKRETIDMLSVQLDEREQRKAIRKMPPLIKGYLRLGARFSTHAVLDPVFGTIDVLVVLPVAEINPKYITYYGEKADRHNPTNGAQT